MRTKIDQKHHAELRTNPNGTGEYIAIVKTGNDQEIPKDEPMILFRGRDKLAVAMLEYYRRLCVDDGCTEYQLETMDVMIGKFKAFSEASPTMKQPGITKGE